MENFPKDGKFDVLPIECTLLFWDMDNGEQRMDMECAIQSAGC
jgi:hypothetical protein